MSAWLWLLVVAAPLLGALLLIVLPAQRDRIIQSLWLSCLPALVLCLWPAQDLQVSELWTGAGLGAADVLSRGWLMFTALLWLLASIAAAQQLGNDASRFRFWLFWQLSLSGNLLLIVAQDALSFYVGFSVMSLAAYGLIIHRGGPAPRRAARLYIQMAVLGEILLFTGIILRSYSSGGAVNFADWEQTAADPLTVILLLTGLGIKAGFWPLHIWLPQAHPIAPAPASAVLSGAMLKAGILGLWRFLPGGSELLQAWAVPLLVIGLISALYAVVVGLGRTQAKQVLAYSSISQMGYLLMIVGLFWLESARDEALSLLLVMYASHHAFCKGALFIGAGLASRASPPRQHRLFWGLLLIPALALAGLPLSSGSAVKILLKDSFTGLDMGGWVMLLQIGALATTLLVARAWYLMRLDADGQERPGSLPLRYLLPLGALVAALLSLPLMWAALREAMVSHLSLGDLVELGWPLLLGLLLAAAAVRLGLTVPRWSVLQANPLLWSLRLRRRLLRPLLPAPRLQLRRDAWRQLERRWNRYWQGDTVVRTAGMLVVFLIVAGLIINLG